jgi:hypothetical protein
VKFYDLLFVVGDSEVERRAGEREDGPDREQEAEVTEDETDEGKQTAGKTKQADTARQADDGTEAQKTHGTAR